MSIPVAPAADNGQWWVQMLSGRPIGTGAAASPEGVNAAADALEAATPTQVEQAVREVNASLQSRSIGLQFEVDQDTDKLIVKVVDRASGEVIRQIPTEEVVRVAKVLGKAPGMLVSQSA
jgi:flagellar protein FlaG